MRLLPFLLFFIAVPVQAQNSPEQVTNAQVVVYRAGMEAGCRNAGREKRDPEARTNAICSCLIQTLDRSMSFAEWQQAFFISTTRGENQAMEFMAPHLAKMRECRL